MTAVLALLALGLAAYVVARCMRCAREGHPLGDDPEEPSCFCGERQRR